jgi:hypothetical protein
MLQCGAFHIQASFDLALQSDGLYLQLSVGLHNPVLEGFTLTSFCETNW